MSDLKTISGMIDEMQRNQREHGADISALENHAKDNKMLNVAQFAESAYQNIEQGKRDRRVEENQKEQRKHNKAAGDSRRSLQSGINRIENAIGSGGGGAGGGSGGGSATPSGGGLTGGGVKSRTWQGRNRLDYDVTSARIKMSQGYSANEDQANKILQEEEAAAKELKKFFEMMARMRSVVPRAADKERAKLQRQLEKALALIKDPENKEALIKIFNIEDAKLGLKGKLSGVIESYTDKDSPFPGKPGGVRGKIQGFTDNLLGIDRKTGRIGAGFERPDFMKGGLLGWASTKMGLDKPTRGFQTNWLNRQGAEEELFTEEVEENISKGFGNIFGSEGGSSGSNLGSATSKASTDNELLTVVKEIRDIVKDGFSPTPGGSYGPQGPTGGDPLDKSDDIKLLPPPGSRSSDLMNIRKHHQSQKTGYGFYDQSRGVWRKDGNLAVQTGAQGTLAGSAMVAHKSSSDRRMTDEEYEQFLGNADDYGGEGRMGIGGMALFAMRNKIRGFASRVGGRFFGGGAPARGFATAAQAGPGAVQARSGRWYNPSSTQGKTILNSQAGTAKPNNMSKLARLGRFAPGIGPLAAAGGIGLDWWNKAENRAANDDALDMGLVDEDIHEEVDLANQNPWQETAASVATGAATYATAAAVWSPPHPLAKAVIATGAGIVGGAVYGVGSLIRRNRAKKIAAESNVFGGLRDQEAKLSDVKNKIPSKNLAAMNANKQKIKKELIDKYAAGDISRLTPNDQRQLDILAEKQAMQATPEIANLPDVQLALNELEEVGGDESDWAQQLQNRPQDDTIAGRFGDLYQGTEGGGSVAKSTREIMMSGEEGDFTSRTFMGPPEPGKPRGFQQGNAWDLESIRRKEAHDRGEDPGRSKFGFKKLSHGGMKPEQYDQQEVTDSLMRHYESKVSNVGDTSSETTKGFMGIFDKDNWREAAKGSFLDRWGWTDDEKEQRSPEEVNEAIKYRASILVQDMIKGSGLTGEVLTEMKPDMLEEAMHKARMEFANDEAGFMDNFGGQPKVEDPYTTPGGFGSRIKGALGRLFGGEEELDSVAKLEGGFEEDDPGQHLFKFTPPTADAVDAGQRAVGAVTGAQAAGNNVVDNSTVINNNGGGGSITVAPLNVRDTGSSVSDTVENFLRVS